MTVRRSGIGQGKPVANHRQVHRDSRVTFQIPCLTTDRLLLRGFERRDFEPYAAMMSDTDVTRYLGAGHPLSRAEAWRQMAMGIGHWKLRGFGLWAVEERSTRRFVGRIGCLEPEGFPAPEIAYTLAQTAWGNGYAREGAEAALRFARDVLKLPTVVSIIRPTNIAAIRVAKSPGAAATETIEFFGALSVTCRYPPA